MSGYTLSYRDKWQHPVFRNLREAGMWSWLCDTAVWKKTKVRFNGIMVDLDRGQLATSVRFMSKGFEVGEQLTRTFLQNLEKEGMINTRPTHWGTIVTICNYDKYQLLENTDNTPSNTRVTHGQHTGNTNKNKDNTSNEVNKENGAIYDAEFETLWNLYPSDQPKGAKNKAKEKFIKARKKHSLEEILLGTRRYAEYCKSTGQYNKHVVTWLNANGHLEPWEYRKERRPDAYQGM